MKRRRYGFIIVLLAVLIAYTHALRSRDIETSRAPFLGSLPEEIGGYTGLIEAEDPEALKLLDADETLFRRYRNDSGRTVWLYIGYFAAPHENSQIHSPKHCYPAAGWNILTEGSTSILLGEGKVAVRHLVISNGVEKHAILYWYSCADGILTNEFALKLNQMKNSLLSRSQATAFVRFSTQLTGGEEAGAERDLVRFAEALAPHAEGVLRGGGAAPGASNRAFSGSTTSERTP